MMQTKHFNYYSVWRGKNIYDRIDTENKEKYNVKKISELTKQ